MRAETYERIAKIAATRRLSVADYLHEVIETMEEDYLTYQAFNASWHATMASHMLVVVIRILTGKKFSRRILSDVAAHMKWQVGKGPSRPTADWSRPSDETDDALMAMFRYYERLLADRLGEIVSEPWDEEDTRGWRGG